MMKNSGQRGFTLIELMISIAIFTGVLVIATVATAQIGRMYYKSLIQANAQQATRQLSDLLGQQIRLFDRSPIAFTYSGGSISPITVNDFNFNVDGARYYLCIESARYYITINRQLKTSPTLTDQVRGVFIQRQADSNDCATLPSVANRDSLWTDPTVAGGTEMMPYNSRLSYMRLNKLNTDNEVWNLDLVVIIGDQDTIEIPGNLLQESRCVGRIIDSQFCATSTLRTAILKRTGD